MSSRVTALLTARDVSPFVQRHRRILGAAVGALLLTGTLMLIFGPARGARDDLGHVHTDLHATRVDIHATLATQRLALGRSSALLRSTQTSLSIAQQGLSVAENSERLAGTTTANTTALLRETTSTSATVRRVLTALGPLQHLRGDLATVVAGVNAGVALARTTLSVARQTLTTGQAALSVAAATLNTLRQSKNIQAQLLSVASETLRQVRALNAKLPLPPIAPSK